MPRQFTARRGGLIFAIMVLSSGGIGVRAPAAEATGAIAATAPASGRLADIPTAADQAKAQKLIEEVYGPYPPAGATPKRKLSRLLLARGQQTTDDPVARFVLLRDAADLARNCGDYETETIAIAEISKRYVLSNALSKRLRELESEYAVPMDAASWGTAPALPNLIDKPLTVGGPGARLRVPATCTIDKGGILKILPGTTLHFEEKAGLIVFGGLSVAADDDHPVILAPSDPTTRWLGIDLQKSPACTLSGCVIQSALCGLKLNVQKTVVVKDCALVSNMVGISIVNAGLEISDSVILRSGRNGVDAGQDQHGKWKHVTIKDSAGAGYSGTFKGWPIMNRCTITGNQGGGLTCMRGGRRYRGRPEVSDSNVFDNSRFDIECNQQEDYEFNDVYVGPAPSKALAQDPNAIVANIRDGRTNQGKGIGKVLIHNPPADPIADAGAPAAVMRLAEAYVHDVMKN